MHFTMLQWVCIEFNSFPHFSCCCIAAAEVTVDDFSAELDLPIPGFDVVKPWMPKLNIGGDSTEQTTALQVSYYKAIVVNMYVHKPLHILTNI